METDSVFLRQIELKEIEPKLEDAEYFWTWLMRTRSITAMGRMDFPVLEINRPQDLKSDIERIFSVVDKADKSLGNVLISVDKDVKMGQACLTFQDHDYWKTNLALEALISLFQKAFQELQVKNLTICSLDPVSSETTIYKEFGLRREGVLSKVIEVEGKEADVVLWNLEAATWQNLTEAMRIYEDIAKQDAPTRSKLYREGIYVAGVDFKLATKINPLTWTGKITSIDNERTLDSLLVDSGEFIIKLPNHREIPIKVDATVTNERGELFMPFKSKIANYVGRMLS